MPKNFLIVERRSKSRIECAYPATIRGVDIHGQPFKETTRITDLSARGLYIMLNTEIDPDSAVFVLFRCSSTTSLETGKSPLVAVCGSVAHTRKKKGCPNGAGIKIRHTRFL